jgi:hypothetical protein
VTAPLTGGLELSEDNRFLVTNMDEDLGEIETLYYEVTVLIYDDDEDFTVTIKACCLVTQSLSKNS